MKILSLKARNFLTIGNAHIHLANKGLVLVQGINEDDSSANSNGAGKSSMSDALSWGLFGKTARGESGDRIVNKTAKKDCVVEIDVMDGDNVIRITRHRKHKEHKNATHVHLMPPEVMGAVAGEPMPLHKGTEAETQLVIEEIVGCSYEVFCAVVYAGQENMPDIPNMTDKQLKSLVEEAAGITRLERAHEVAKEKRLDAERKVLSAEASLRTLTDTLDRTRTVEAEQVASDLNAWEERRTVEVDRLLVEADTHRGHAVKLAAELKEIPVVEIEVRLADISSQLSSINAKQTEAGRAAAKVLVAEREEATLRAQLEAAVKEVKHIDEEIAALEGGMPCPTCGAAATPDTIDTARATLAEKRASKLAAALKLRELLSEAKIATAGATAAAAEASAAVPDATALNTTANELREVKARADSLRSTATLHVNSSKTATAQAEAKKAEVNPFIATQNRLLDRVLELTRKHEAASDELAKLRENYEVADAVVRVFSPAGVRAHILDTVTPFLNERTAEYLSILSDGNINAVWSTLSTTTKGEIREKFVIDVENDKGAESFGGLSGGEKRKVRLSCMLALQDLVSARATKPIELWVGDEVDDAMDASGQERLMTILDKKARERGTVLVVSHNDLKDWADQVMTVRKRDGYSTVEGALVV